MSTSAFFENMRHKGTEQPSRPGANRRISSEALLAHIRAIHVEVKQEYGWPKMWKELVARGIRVGKEPVRRNSAGLAKPARPQWLRNPACSGRILALQACSNMFPECPLDWPLIDFRAARRTHR